MNSQKPQSCFCAHTNVANNKKLIKSPLVFQHVSSSGISKYSPRPVIHLWQEVVTVMFLNVYLLVYLINPTVEFIFLI